MGMTVQLVSVTALVVSCVAFLVAVADWLQLPAEPVQSAGPDLPQDPQVPASVTEPAPVELPAAASAPANRWRDVMGA